MKHTIWLLLIGIVFCFAKCGKEKPIDSNSNNIPGLPPATQTGANTLGFLLNGVPWIPAGNNGTANLSIDFDPGISNGYVSIASYSSRLSNRSDIIIAVKDSLNFAIPPITYKIGNIYNGFVLFTDNAYCERRTTDTSTFSNGFITVTDFNRTIGIISGIFECTIYNPACGDTVKITQGRFDMKF